MTPSIGKTLSTTTYSYDANGNLMQTGGWSYMWDYLNRMLASGFNNSTTTYAYDPSGARVLQTSTTSTTYYPNKYYSFMSTKIGANTYATSTNYIWNGDTLLATIDQKLYNGTATGTPITRYIHPDHLGSTNVVTDASGTVAQLLDYYPYGGTRISSNTYPTNEKRQYIGQYSDTGTGLNYLNARYYNPQQGQFISQDPVFWGSQNLYNPQSLNAYSYANDNPINAKDPSGQSAVTDLYGKLIQVLTQLCQVLGGCGGGGGGGTSGPTAPNPAATSPKGGGGGAVAPTGSVNVPVVWKTQMPDMTGCLKACETMAGYVPSGSVDMTKHDAKGNLIPATNASQGIKAIDSYLTNGSAVIVGVNRGDGGEISVNTNPASEHYVTITGSGVDSNGKYYTFYDPGTSRQAAGTSPSNKLYLGSDYKLSGATAYSGANYTVTEVKTK